MNMRKTMLMILAVVMLLPAAVSGTIAEEKDDWEGLAWMYRIFGENISPQLLDEVHREFQPVKMDCGDVQIVLREVLYDGKWMYTAATAVPTRKDEVILMPGSAGIDERIAGGWGENLRDDQRSFGEAAIEEGKDLLIVTAFPAEFDAEECYFTDHRQDSGDQSTLFSGAEVPHYIGTGKISFRVETQRISAVSGKEISSEAFDFPVGIICPGTEQQAYQTADEGLPFRRMTLTRTALATYVSAEWEDPSEIRPMQLLSEEGNEYTRGNPDDVYSFRMEFFPQRIGVKIEGNDTVHWYTKDN